MGKHEAFDAADAGCQRVADDRGRRVFQRTIALLQPPFVQRDPALLHRRYLELDCGASGGRLLTLRGATLLHAAAEYGFFDATRLLLDRGSDVNARADIDAAVSVVRPRSFTL